MNGNKVYQYYLNDANADGTPDDSYTYIYSYDIDGNMKTQVYIDDDNLDGDPEKTKIYTYGLAISGSDLAALTNSLGF
jgi:hypothetical protein